MSFIVKSNLKPVHYSYLQRGVQLKLCISPYPHPVHSCASWRSVSRNSWKSLTSERRHLSVISFYRRSRGIRTNRTHTSVPLLPPSFASICGRFGVAITSISLRNETRYGRFKGLFVIPRWRAGVKNSGDISDEWNVHGNDKSQPPVCNITQYTHDKIL